MSRRKVVLYNPDAVFWTMPLALVAVASALDRERWEPVIVDGRLESRETLMSHLEDAACLGITVLTGRPLRDALEVSRAARARFPELPIVWGGWHPSLFPEMCAAEESVTAAVTGQGEETFPELLERFTAGASPSGVAGCAHRNGGEVRVEPPRPMGDVDRFPRHDYGLLDVERYFERKGQLDYVSSQGCRFRCAFCSDPAVFGRGWYGYAPERMVEEIADLWRRHRFDDLSFQDETYFTYEKRVAGVAEGFLREGLRFSWLGTIRVDQGRRLDESVLALCARSGLRRVMMGLEAGSQETLDRIQKDIRVEDVWITVEKLLRHGVGVLVNVIVGFPDEPPESVRETLRVARRLRATSPDVELAIFQYKPYPGNPITDRLRAGDYRLPGTLEEWADFDYVGGESDWLTANQKREIENFKFYQRVGYSGNRSLWRRPLQTLSRWRVERGAYGFPVERRLAERIRPSRALS